MTRGWFRSILCAGLLLAAGGLFSSMLQQATLPRADLVVGNGAEPQSLDPAAATALPEMRVLSCLFEGLVTPHPRTLEPLPAAAASWSVSEDGLTWRFNLWEGLCWSDGHPLTAGGLRWSYLRFLDPATAAPYAYLLWCVRGARAFTSGRGSREDVAIRAPGPRTLVFSLEHPVPYFLDLVGHFALLPVPRHVVRPCGTAWVKPGNLVGNGPFVLEQRRLKDRIRLRRNPLYRDRESVSLETVDMLATESKATLLNLYVAGKVDWVTDVPGSAVPALLEQRGPGATGEFVPTPTLGTYYLRVNVTRPPFHNVKVRRALSLAVDRQAVVQDVTRSGEIPARSFVPPGVAHYEPPRVLEHAPSRARELLEEGLAEEGLEDLPPFELLYNTGRKHRAIAELLQHQWRTALGAEVRLRNMEWGSFQTATRTLDYTVARASWYGDYNDPATFLDMYVSEGRNNQTGFADPAYDRAVRKASLQVGDREKRAAVLRRAERSLLEQAPIIPVFHDVSRNLVKPRVTGFHQNVRDLHPIRFLDVRGPEGLR